MILETNIFWILLFVFQIIILNLLSITFHNYLYLLTGLRHGGSRFSQKIYSFFLFLGTLVHELSHILMAAILFVRVKGLNLKSEIVEDKHIRLGTAEVELVDPLRNALVGVAPLLFGLTFIYFLASGVGLQNFTWMEFFKLLLISQISNSMFLSKSDTVYFKYVIFLLFAVVLIVIITNYFYNFFNIDTYIQLFKNFLISQSFTPFLKNLNIVFLFIVIFNFAIVLFLKFLSKYKRY